MGDFDCCETQAQVRAAALLAGVDAHYAREQKRGDERARMADCEICLGSWPCNCEPWSDVPLRYQALIATLLERTEERDSARRFAVALEQRLDEIRQFHHNDGDGWCDACCFCSPCQTVRLIDAELVADA